MSSVQWAESRKGRQVVTTTQHVNLKKQNVGGQGGMVSYEDLLIAQYLDELRNSQRKRGPQSAYDDEVKPSPYTQKLPHSDYSYKYRTTTRRRPASASNVSSKPKIDAKFIADPSLWDPATPRNDTDEGPEKYQLIINDRNLHARPASAPVKRNKIRRPISAASTISKRPWSGRSATYIGGRRIKSQYKKQPQTIRVTAFKNGTREPFVRLAAPSIKILLEYCTDKLGLPFAARRVFLEDGIEVFCEKDIPLDSEVYISTGENFKDAYAATKRNIILSNSAKWTLEGVMFPAEGKKKVSKPRLSKRLKKLADYKRVRIIVYRNGKCTEPVEVVADLSNKEEFLVACTAKLDLRSHARLVYDWEGNEIDCLADTPILDECLQQGGTYVLGPVWVSTGEGFSPAGTKDFLVTIIEVIKTRLKESRSFRKELVYMMEGQKDQVKIAIKILSMSKEELEETLTYTDSDISQLTETLKGLDERLEALQEKVQQEESEGTNYRMRHIKTLPEDRLYQMVGAPGLKLKVHENGTINMPRDFYFNLRKAAQGSDDKASLLQRLLDELSGCFVNPQTPKLAPIAKKIFNQFGREVTDVKSLKTDDEIWVSFGESFISPFTYALQVVFDLARGKDVFGEKKVILREQMGPDSLVEGMTEHENYEASIGFPVAVEYEECKFDGEREHVESLASMAELDQRGTFLHFISSKKTVLYPEIIMNAKLPRGHKEVWPSEAQVWVISKAGFIYCKPFPQLCLAVLEQRIETTLVGKGTKLEGYVVALEKKMVGNPHQMWTFNPDATISSKAYPNLLLTYINKKYGEESDESTQPEGLKPGNRVYLMLNEPLKKEMSYQRFALKQERLDNLGQWKFNEASNPEWNKQALSWPVRADGSINEDYDWPMEGYLLPNAPRLHKANAGDDGFVGMIPLRLLVAKNGERNLSLAVPVVGPNLTNFMKDTSKKPQKTEKSRRRGNKPQQGQDEMGDDELEGIEMDTNLHCRELTIRELEFTMFLDHCTSILNLPFAGRRLYDENGNEHFTLKTLKRDQLVYVSCGEIWSDPNLTRIEQQRRLLLSQLLQDMAKMRQYAALRNPEKYVLEVDPSMNPNSPVTVNRLWTKEDEQREQDDISVVSRGNPAGSVADPNAEFGSPRDDDVRKSYHEQAHERSERRLENLKWPWERLVNVNNSFDNDPEASKYTDREMYEKFKPKPVSKLSRDTLQRFEFSDGFIAMTSNRNLVLGVSEPEGRTAEVHLVKRRPDDIYQQWMMKQNGEIRSRFSQQKVLTVSMPNNEPFAEDEEGRPLTFSGCKVTLQNRINNEFGKAHQRWRYDAETGFIHAFSADLPDKEITAANKADVCTFAIASNSKIDQPGYVAEVPVQLPNERATVKQIMVCMSCARAMRGRYKLTRLSSSTLFSCAMGNAKKLKLQQIGSFRVLNGKVDLSSHEYELTLQEWEDKVAKLMAETSAKTINKEISVARTVKTVKVLAYKNGEGRLRQGEIICGSSVEGILSQCTQRLGLSTAAARMYAEDGTLIVEMEDLVEWAVQNYRSMMADQLEKLFNGKTVDGTNERGEGEGEENQEGEGEDKENAETDQKETDKSTREREYLLSQVRLPSQETILRYPIEIWVSSGKPFVPPEVVESKLENRKKKRAFRSAVSMELDIEKHCLRQMKGRRLEELSPGEYKGTKNSQKPVVVEGHWEEPTPEEQEKHHTVHKLEEHLNEVRKNQREKTAPLIFNMEKGLYKQPQTVRVQVYPNGETVERAIYIWGENIDQILDMATMRLNLWQPAKRLFNMEGKEITKFSEIKRDELLCVSTGKPFKHTQTSRLDIEVKANWSRAHKQYGPTATDVHVEAPENPKVHVDPFGPPALALPITSGETSSNGNNSRPPRPKSAKPISS